MEQVGNTQWERGGAESPSAREGTGTALQSATSISRVSCLPLLVVALRRCLLSPLRCLLSLLRSHFTLRRCSASIRTLALSSVATPILLRTQAVLGLNSHSGVSSVAAPLSSVATPISLRTQAVFGLNSHSGVSSVAAPLSSVATPILLRTQAMFGLNSHSGVSSVAAPLSSVATPVSLHTQAVFGLSSHSGVVFCLCSGLNHTMTLLRWLLSGAPARLSSDVASSPKILKFALTLPPP